MGLNYDGDVFLVSWWEQPWDEVTYMGRGNKEGEIRGMKSEILVVKNKSDFD